MPWFKKIKVEPVKHLKEDDLDEAIKGLFQKMGLDIQAMVKEAFDSADKKDLERLELILTTCKPEIDKAIKEGYINGLFDVPLVNYNVYHISEKLKERVAKKYGILIDYMTDEYYHTDPNLCRPATKGTLHFRLEKR